MHAYTYTRIYTLIQTYTRIYSHIHAYTRTYTHLRKLTHIHAYTHIYHKHAYTYIYIYIRIYTLMHAYTRICASNGRCAFSNLKARFPSSPLFFCLLIHNFTTHVFSCSWFLFHDFCFENLVSLHAAKSGTLAARSANPLSWVGASLAFFESTFQILEPPESPQKNMIVLTFDHNTTN